MIDPKTEAAINAADQTALVMALRAFATVALWKMSEAELRDVLRVGIRGKDFTPAEVIAALDRVNEETPNEPQ